VFGDVSGLLGCYATSLHEFPTFRNIVVLGLLYPEDRGITNLRNVPASLLASFPCKRKTFRKKVKNVVTGEGILVGIECEYVEWCGAN
jgi:hypothetical protein